MCEQSLGYAKFEYKGMKTVGVTDNTNQKPPIGPWPFQMENVYVQHP